MVLKLTKTWTVIKHEFATSSENCGPTPAMAVLRWPNIYLASVKRKTAMAGVGP